jgi:hypothetical protein
MTRAELLEVVYRFYPRGVPSWDRFFVPPGERVYDDTEEREHQREAARRGFDEYPTWDAMISRLDARYPLTNRALCLLAESYTPAYFAQIEIPGRLLGFHVSLLGPYYGIHRTGLAVEELPALDLTREIEATYPGYEPIPPELGDEVVPDVSMNHRPLGKATIYDCLLSPDWEESSEPWPPEKTPEEGMGDLVAKRAAQAKPHRSTLGKWVGRSPPITGEPRDDSRPDETLDIKRRPPGGQ